MKKRIKIWFLLLGIICSILFAMSACKQQINENYNSVSMAASSAVSASIEVPNTTSEQPDESTTTVVKVLDEKDYFFGKFKVKKTEEQGKVKTSILRYNKLLYEFDCINVYINITCNEILDRYVIEVVSSADPFEPFLVFDHATNKVITINKYRSSALIYSEGNQYVPFGEYGKVDLSKQNSIFLCAYNNFFAEDRSYFILDKHGEIVTGPFYAANECILNPGLFDVFYKDGDSIKTKALYINEKTYKITEYYFYSYIDEFKVDYEYKDEIKKVIDPFYDAIRNNDREAITNIIGKVRADKIYNTIDTISDDYYNYDSYKTEDEQFAWLIKFSEYLLRNTNYPSYNLVDIHIENNFKSRYTSVFANDLFEVIYDFILVHDEKGFSIDNVYFSLYSCSTTPGELTN